MGPGVAASRSSTDAWEARRRTHRCARHLPRGHRRAELRDLPDGHVESQRVRPAADQPSRQHGQLACRDRGAAELRKGLHRGRFFLVVRARGRAHGTYTVTRIDRALTGLGLRANGQRRLRVPPRTTVRLGLAVRPSVDGPADIRIERFDPLTGWHFDRMVRVLRPRWTQSFPFVPPAEGTWRADAHFRGTNRASPSDSRRVRIIVQAPLGADDRRGALSRARRRSAPPRPGRARSARPRRAPRPRAGRRPAGPCPRGSR